MNEEELIKRLQEAFAIESKERLTRIALQLVELEQLEDCDPDALLESIYRDAHSLKGAARAVGMEAIEVICQAMEEIFGLLKAKRLKTSALMFDTLHQAHQDIEKILNNKPEKVQTPDVSQRVHQLHALLDLPEEARIDQETPLEPQTQNSQIQSELIEEKQSSTAEENDPNLSPPPLSVSPTSPPSFPDDSVAPPPILKNAEQTEPPTEPTHSETRSNETVPEPSLPTESTTLRVSGEKLDRMLRHAEEMIGVKQGSQYLTSHLQELSRRFQLWNKQQMTLDRIEKSLLKKNDSPSPGEISNELNDYLLWSRNFITAMQRDIATLISVHHEQNYQSGRIVEDLMDGVKDLLLQPFSTLLAPLPLMVRKMSRSLNKRVRLQIEGAEYEADRRIIEGIKDPINHLLRNALDHGIEPEEVRQKKNKLIEAMILIKIERLEGQRLQISIKDDGAGIDLQSLQEQALKLKWIDKESASQMSEAETLQLIFRSGLTTAPIITRLSGRGLGMSIVQSSVEQLGGTVSVSSQRDQGTTFTISLPVSLSLFNGILVVASGDRYILPSAQTERVRRVKRDEIRYTENRPTILHQNRPVSLVTLASLLQRPEINSQSDTVKVVIINLGQQHVALQIDEMLGESEFMVKGMGRQLKYINLFSGATLLPTGEVIPILRVEALLQKILLGEGSFLLHDLNSDEEAKEQAQLLVVEDSITSRVLLKNILQAAGYRVTTAVDGEQGLFTLQNGDFDLVVSDVEMPIMNGFEMTQAIRSDNHLENLPVILVTSLESNQDREQGIDAGANAYIVKGKFDQGNLLETIERLIC